MVAQRFTGAAESSSGGIGRYGRSGYDWHGWCNDGNNVSVGAISTCDRNSRRSADKRRERSSERGGNVMRHDIRNRH